MAFLRSSRPDKASGLEMVIFYSCALTIAVAGLIAIGTIVVDLIAWVIR